MQIDAKNGLLLGVSYIPSPNFNARPQGTVIDMVVIHNISLPPNEFGGPYISAFFRNQLDHSLHPYFMEIADKKVSSHCLIRRDGEVIQYVPFSERAWHAGISQFAGKDNCNDFSIGIELEGVDTIPYTDIQYRVLAKLIKLLQAQYPAITNNRITGHSIIAPGRKTDPGPAFDWERLNEDIRDLIG